MSICYGCGNNLTEHMEIINKLVGRSSHERFFVYKDEKDKNALGQYILKNKIPICCSTILTTHIDNRFLHHTPY